MKRRSALLVLVAVFCGLTVVLPAQGALDGMPVSRGSLFSSGVGYFEHAATVSGDVQFRLIFNVRQINDVLKSMVLRDLDGGSVSMITYPSSEPLERTLQSFAVDLGSASTMATLLRQLRGAEMTLYTPTAIHGRLIGLETRKVAVPGSTALVDEVFLNVLTPDGLRSVLLSPLVSIRLRDEALNDELNRALNLILEANDPNRKPVALAFSGSGRRRVRVGYVTETPVWKTSYRLDLAGARPFLQAWAIVENSSEFDWDGVSLSLVVGRPISFTQDLYTPLYNRRPVVQTALQSAPTPTAYNEGVAAPRSMTAPSVSPMAEASRRESASGGYADMAAEEQESFALSESGVSAAAAGERAGELFAFTIQEPVSLARRQSAMLPIYNGNITVEKLSIYSLGQGSQYPLNGARITNDSGMQLPPGPITVFDGGNYAGDALIDSFMDGDRRLISYAVDQTVLVQVLAQEDRAISTARIVSGVLTVERLGVFSQTYRIANRAVEAKLMLIEHPLYHARTLVEPAAPEEQTASHRRFRLTVPAGATVDFVVREQQVFSESITLLGNRNTSYLTYSTQGEIPRAVRDALIRAGELYAAVSTVNTRLSELTREKSLLETSQSRLRANIETVGRASPEGVRFLQRLMADEDRLEQIATALNQAAEDLRRAQTELDNYLRTLTVR
ncbi:MAG: hypothetical protein A2004_08830 [Spirochaetes bacterium GWC1_61_12]|nr:MAG: hypothetical protein A2004_08830 [Spirochaetes bacterium GWC1_61_12]